MLDAVLPVAEDVLLSEFAFLGRNLVRHVHVVGHRDLLVPAIGTALLLALEGIPGTHRRRELGQSDNKSGVGGALCNACRSSQIPLGVRNLVASIDG